METELHSAVTILKCGLFFDGYDVHYAGSQYIHIVDNIVSEVSAEGATKYNGKDVRVTEIDLSELFVLPGLIDCHVHPCILDVNTYQQDHMNESSAYKALRALKNCQSLLLAGWTTVRVAGDADIFYANFSVKKVITEGHFVGPRITGAGHYISSTGGGGDLNHISPDQKRCCCPDGLIVDGMEEMRKAVREEVKYGSDWIKILVTGTFLGSGDNPNNTMYSQEELNMAVSEANMLGVPVMAHAHGTAGIKMALKAGVRSIEHGSFIDTEAINMMLERGVFLVPTFTIGDYIMREENKSNAPSKYVELSKKTDALYVSNMKAAILAGVKIVTGTDYCGWPETSFNVRELLRLVECGMKPIQALRAATTVSAELLQWSDKVGSIVKGRFADIIAVKKNPLEDISVLSSVDFVMKDGVVIKQNGLQVKF